MMPQITEPDDDNKVLKLTTNMAAPTNDTSTNAERDNQHQQVTNVVIDKVSGNLLEYRNLIKGPNTKIW